MDSTDAVAAGRQRMIGVADVVRIPLRRLRIVLGVTAGLTLAVAGYLLVVPPTWTAAAVVVLRPVVTDPFTYPSGGADRAVNMTAENGIATGNEVVDATARAVGRNAQDTRDALTVEVPTGGQVLRFGYAGRSETEAVAGANAAAQAYLTVRAASYQQQRVALLASYDTTIKAVADQRSAAQKPLPKSGGNASVPPATQAVLDQVRSLNDQVAQLANQRAKISSADLSPGAVTSAARAPAESNHDAWWLYVLAALLGGLLIGVTTAHVREVFDRRIRTLDQAADATGLPALGVVRPGRRADADARYVALAVTRYVDGQLSTENGRPGTQNGQQGGGRQPLVVLSGRGDEGRTRVAGGLAVAIAESGHDVYLGAAAESMDELRTILFAAQRDHPPMPRIRLHHDDHHHDEDEMPGVPAVNGSSGTYGSAGVVRLAERESAVPVPSAVLIGAGSVRLGPLGAPPPGSIAVLDAPPAETDARGVRAAQSGVAVLVIGRDRTRDVELGRLVDRLRSAGTRTVGFVLTGGGRG
jgi:capsular polysaccharide biosynthesis protein